MAGAFDGDAPQDLGSPNVNFDYYFTMPQLLFQDPTPPPPAVIDFEIHEETVGVFGFLVYDDGIDNGKVVVTSL